MGTVKRRGTLLLLVVLPDGSRSLVPAGWTDWKATTQAVDEPSTSGSGHGERCLAPLTDLLHARAIVDALLGRLRISLMVSGEFTRWCAGISRDPQRPH